MTSGLSLIKDCEKSLKKQKPFTLLTSVFSFSNKTTEKDIYDYKLTVTFYLF